MNWCRLWHSVLTNPKVQKLSDREFKCWINMLLVASMREPRGTLPDDAVLAFSLRVRVPFVAKLITKLERNNLVEISNGIRKMHDWDEFQFESDDINQRVRNHRKRSSNVSGNVTCNAHETPSDTDTDTDTDTESFKPPISPTPKPGVADVSVAPPAEEKILPSVAVNGSLKKPPAPGDEEMRALIALGWVGPKKTPDAACDAIVEWGEKFFALDRPPERLDSAFMIWCRLSWFEDFWLGYWLHRSKKTARAAYFEVVKTLEFADELLLAVQAQTPEMLTRPKGKRPLGATWLHDERWNDSDDESIFEDPRLGVIQ